MRFTSKKMFTENGMQELHGYFKRLSVWIAALATAKANANEGSTQAEIASYFRQRAGHESNPTEATLASPVRLQRTLMKGVKLGRLEEAERACPWRRRAI